MDKRTVGIIATVATSLLCGCPGLFGLCWGAIAVPVSFMPNANIDIGGSSDPTTALMTGIAALCVGLIFIAIPVIVGFVTLRRKNELPAAPVYNDPIPPAL